MRIIYFDCYSGVAGDMVLAALLDLGLDRDRWLNSIKRLPIGGYKIDFEQVQRHGMSSLRVKITVTDPQPHRHLNKITEIINRSDLPEKVKTNAIAVFTTLAEAEAKIHGCSVEAVHFHEVGAVDAIIDIVGCCLALEMLNIDTLYCSPIGQGGGISKSAHGPLPLPPPASLEILRDTPTRFHDIDTELATPTGAALMKTLAKFVPPTGVNKVIATGYGAGSKDIPSLPGMVRALLMEQDNAQISEETVLLETNIDDLNPELYPYVIEKLLTAGAMDAYLVPIIMKKGRPGIILSALCNTDFKDRMLDVIYTETSTLGVRVIPIQRLKLDRRGIEIQTRFGMIKGKETEWNGRVRSAPEYEACRKIALEKKVSLQEVYQAYYQALIRE